METRSLPRYPKVSVQLHTRNPYALVSAIRTSLRHEGLGKNEIESFTAQALETSDPLDVQEVCSGWVHVVLPSR